MKNNDDMKWPSARPPQEPPERLAELGRPNISVFFLLLICFSIAIVSVFFIKVESVVSGMGTVAAGRGLQSLKSQEGGILEELYVKEGQDVKAGDELALLANTGIMAKRLEVAGEMDLLRAKSYRLEQEKLGADVLEWPEELQEVTSSETLAMQKELFLTRKQRFGAELAAIEYERNALQQELSAARGELSALEAEIAAVKNILDFKREGRANNFVSKADVLQAESQYAQIVRERAKVQGRIPTLTSQIAETEKKLLERTSHQRQSILDEEEEALSKVRALEAETSAAVDRDDRRILRSPVDAVVNTIHVRGRGDVIAPTDPIIDIVPVNQGLIVRAKIDPSLRRGLYEGLPAKISFSALQDLRVAPMDGTVTFVAPDTQTDADGRTHYEVHVTTQDDTVELPNGGSMRIEAGMQASVNIVVGKHSVANFLLSPLEWVFDNAFRQR